MLRWVKRLFNYILLMIFIFKNNVPIIAYDQRNDMNLNLEFKTFSERPFKISFHSPNEFSNKSFREYSFYWDFPLFTPINWNSGIVIVGFRSTQSNFFILFFWLFFISFLINFLSNLFQGILNLVFSTREFFHKHFVFTIILFFKNDFLFIGICWAILFTLIKMSI